MNALRKRHNKSLIWQYICVFTCMCVSVYLWVPGQALMSSSVAVDKCFSSHFITEPLAWLAGQQT